MARNVWLGCVLAGSAVVGVGCSSSSSPAAPAGDAGGDVTDASSDAGMDAAIVDASVDAADAMPAPSGVLDRSFNDGGVALGESTSSGAGRATDQANAVAVDSQGDVVVAGWTKVSGGGSAAESAIAWRYLADGAPDPAFGTDGGWSMTHTAGVTDSLDLGTSLCLDQEGNIVVGGVAHATTPPVDMALWRLTPGGVLDSTFDTTGTVVTTDVTGAVGASWDEAHAVACTPAGVVVAGFTDTEAQPLNGANMALWRFVSAGLLDTANFNAPKGYVAAMNATGTELSPGDSANAVAVDGMGRIVVAGAGPDANGNYNAALWRYTSAGAVDATFNGTGHATFVGADGSTSLAAVAVALDESQFIVFLATGSSGSSASALSVVARVTSAGFADATFGGSGFVKLAPPLGGAFATGIVTASGLAIDSTGRIVVSGSITVGAVGYAAAWRLFPSGALDASFGDGGVFTTTGAAGGSVDGANAVAMDRFDRPVLVGSSGYADAGVATAMAIWRLTP